MHLYVLWNDPSRVYGLGVSSMIPPKPATTMRLQFGLFTAIALLTLLTSSAQAVEEGSRPRYSLKEVALSQQLQLTVDYLWEELERKKTDKYPIPQILIDGKPIQFSRVQAQVTVEDGLEAWHQTTSVQVRIYSDDIWDILHEPIFATMTWGPGTEPEDPDLQIPEKSFLRRYANGRVVLFPTRSNSSDQPQSLDDLWSTCVPSAMWKKEYDKWTELAKGNGLLIDDSESSLEKSLEITTPTGVKVFSMRKSFGNELLKENGLADAITCTMWEADGTFQFRQRVTAIATSSSLPNGTTE